jgi:hypothetical protein
MLAALQRLLREKGDLNRDLLKACPYTPSAQTYRHDFGSLVAAYELIGYDAGKRWRAKPPPTDAEILSTLRLVFEERGYLNPTIIEADPRTPGVTMIRKRFGSLRRAYELAGLPHTDHVLRSSAQRRRNAKNSKP